LRELENRIHGKLFDKNVSEFLLLLFLLEFLRQTSNQISGQNKSGGGVGVGDLHPDVPVHDVGFSVRQLVADKYFVVRAVVSGKWEVSFRFTQIKEYDFGQVLFYFFTIERGNSLVIFFGWGPQFFPLPLNHVGSVCGQFLCFYLGKWLI
jgi:hypothetical protein